MKSLIALFLGAAALNLGLALQGTLLGVRAGIENFSTIATGLVMSGYYVGFVVGSLVAPPLVNRVGHIRTFATFASLASAAALCHAVFVDPVSWTVLRMMTGLCFAALCLVTESWLNEKSTNENRGGLLSAYLMSILSATALGQALLPMAPAVGYDLFVMVSVILSLALIPVALTSTPMPVDIEPQRMHWRKLYEKSPVGVMGCFGAGVGTGAFWGLGAVYAHDIGFDTSDIAMFMAMMILGGVLTQWPLGRLSDTVDRRLVIAGISFVLAAVGATIASGVVSGGVLLFVAAALAGGMLLPLYGVSIAHANDFMDVKDFVPGAASLLLVYGCGAALGPVIATGFMSWVGPEGLFLHASVVALLVGVFVLYRMTRRDAVPEDQVVDFSMASRTSVVAFEIDPRSEDEDQIIVPSDS